jgi:hypothetical protein
VLIAWVRLGGTSAIEASIRGSALALAIRVRAWTLPQSGQEGEEHQNAADRHDHDRQLDAREEASLATHYSLTPVCIVRALKASGNRLYCFSLTRFTNWA